MQEMMRPVGSNKKVRVNREEKGCGELNGFANYNWMPIGRLLTVQKK
jgi:hypothetical protein